jgi:hypothetical protein
MMEDNFARAFRALDEATVKLTELGEMIDGTDILVCVTHNVPAEEDDSRPPAGDGYVWETIQWVDWARADMAWPRYRERIDIPFPPTHWQPLPDPPQ